MQREKKTCLGCKYFRLEDIHSGICRVEKDRRPYPVKLHGDLCPRWTGCGQQYFIRLGWMRSKVAAEEAKKGA